jgi:hypothetical protein
MTAEEKIERLTNIVDSLPSSVVAHDNRIEVLINVAEKQSVQIAAMERQWQAYINALRRHESS